MFSSTMGLQAAYQARSLAPSCCAPARCWQAACRWLRRGAMHFIGMLAFNLCARRSRLRHRHHRLVGAAQPGGIPGWPLKLLSQLQVTRRQLIFEWRWWGQLHWGHALHRHGRHANGTGAALRPLGVRSCRLRVAAGLGHFGPVGALGLATVSGPAPGHLANTHQRRRDGVWPLPACTTPAWLRPDSLAPFPRPTSAPQDPSTLALSITLVVTLVGTGLVAAASGLAQYRLLVQELKSKRNAPACAISDTSLDAIIVFDAQGTIHEFQPGAERIYRWPTEEMLGQSVLLLMGTFRTQARHDFAGLLQQKRLADRVERETSGVRRDGIRSAHSAGAGPHAHAG